MAAEERAERRLITAMFVDIVRSTDLAAALGPERVKRALDKRFAELSAAVTAEGGTVEKFIGDEVFALFGAPVSHDDDPLRALRAAERCQASTGPAAPDGIPLAVRIGIETGEALVDLAAATIDRQRMAVGECVTVAARLRALADPGTTVIGPVCREAVGDAATFEPLGQLELKGLGPVPAWRLGGIAHAHQRPHLPFVGREAELEVVQLAYRRAAGGRSVLALVSGPPGQGKTRLIEELVSRIGGGAIVLSARCRPAGEVGPFQPLRELLGATTAGELRARVASVITDGAEAERVSDALAHSAGLAVSDALRTMPVADREDEITNAWRRYLAALAGERPLLAWVEDLHWGDPQVVALIDRLTLSGSAPLLVIATARPEFAQQAGLRPTGHRFFIDLEPLEAGDASRLAALAGAAGDPETARAEGNPLFIIELARTRAQSDDSLPLTLRGAIGARLDDLPSPERQLLQAVSIVGEAFTVADAALLTKRQPAELRGSLDRLVDLHYLRSTPEGAYRFHHGLVRDVAYGQLPIADRLGLHARYAREGLVESDHERRAHHLWAAIGGPDAGWVWEDAAERRALRAAGRDALLESARAASEHYLLDAAVERAQRALALADDALDRARAEYAIGDAHNDAAAGDEAWVHLRRALDGYREAGVRPPATIHVAIVQVAWRGGGLRLTPDAGEIERVLAEGLELAREQRDVLSEARLLAQVARRSPDEATRRQTLSQVVALLDGVEDQRRVVGILTLLGLSELEAGRPLETQKILERVAALGAESAGYHQLLALTAFRFGDLATLDSATAEEERLLASAGPHLRMHPLLAKATGWVARGEWRALRDGAAEVARTMDLHPETAFCGSPAIVLAYGTAAAALEGSATEARELLARAMRITEQPGISRSRLGLAFGALGRRGELLQLLDDEIGRISDRSVTDLLVALAQLDEWERVARRLPELEERAARGSLFAQALAAALREELAAAGGGPRPAHAALHAMGYPGFSELLAFRPRIG